MAELDILAELSAAGRMELLDRREQNHRHLELSDLGL